MRTRTYRIALAAIVIVTLIRVASTHRVFSETSDENAHVAGGHEWLTARTYRIDPTHPPLARIFFALPFRDIPPAASRYENFPHLLFGHNGDYVHNVASARRGNLIFLALALIVTALWTRRRFGEIASLVATGIVAMTPPVLAHAGLATTDMPVTATLLFALYALELFLDEPSWKHAIVLGIAAGCGLTSKFSFIPFFAIAAVVLIAVRRVIPSVRIVGSLLIALLFVWSIYKFSWGPMEDEYKGMTKATAQMLHSARLALVPIPAPAFFTGILAVQAHDVRGHTSYLYGRVSDHGFWNYFLVALAVKTPIPLLLLFFIGLVAARRNLDLLLIVAAILGYAMTSNINIGIRHVLPLYPLMAMIAASVVTLPRTRVVTITCLAWLVANTELAHPDYLAWFNAFAGREPSHVLVDSNLDWGQDLLRLASACRERHVDALNISLFTPADLHDVGLPPTKQLDWYTPVRGWVAVSETSLQLARAQGPMAFRWLDGHAYERIGKTILLYRLP